LSKSRSIAVYYSGLQDNHLIMFTNISRNSSPSPFPSSLLQIGLLLRRGNGLVITVTLVSDRKVKRRQRQKYRTIESRLFTAWDRYANGELSAMRLLSECAHFTAF